MNEALPYLEISKDNLTEEEIKINVEVPNVIGLTYKEAKEIMQQCGLEITFRNEVEDGKVSDDFVISNQVPNSGVQILEGSSIIVE